jgi:hypothetical protein
MPDLGDADGTSVRMMHAADRSSSMARINGLAVVWRFGLRPSG